MNRPYGREELGSLHLVTGRSGGDHIDRPGEWRMALYLGKVEDDTTPI